MEGFLDLLNYGFFQNALAAAFLTSLACGVVGTYIVARRMVFISGGITHASFGGIGLGYYLGINPFLGAVVFGIASALGIEWISRKQELRSDTAIGILWSFGMAIGIIFVFLTPGYAPNLMSFLFGNILTVSAQDLWLMVIISALILLVFLLFYQLILHVSFDEEYALTHRLPVKATNYLMISLVALTIVLSIRVVGIILVISLLTLPQSVAALFSRKFRTIIFGSVFFGFLGSVIGLLASWFLNLPSGAAIIVSLAGLFALARILRWFVGSFLKKQARA